MIKDLRATPYPADLKVIREPGMFTGWSLTVEIDGKTHSVVINRSDSYKIFRERLLEMADELEGK